MLGSSGDRVQREGKERLALRRTVDERVWR